MLKGKNFMSMKNAKSLVVVCALASLLAACNQAETANTNSNGATAASAPVSNASPVAASDTPAPTKNPPASIAGDSTAASTATSSSTTTTGNAEPDAPKVNRMSNAKAVPMPQPQIGSGGNDLLLFTRIRSAIDTDADLKRANIIIDISDGVVTLNGTVAGDAQKARAEQLVKNVGGIKGVKNQLKLSAKGANPSS